MGFDAVISPFTEKISSDRYRLWIASLLVALGTVMVFSGALRNGFVDYDDAEYITENPFLKDGITWAALRWAFTPGASPSWHPLAWCSHLLDCQVFGLKPWGHHLTGILWHAASAGLAVVILMRLCRSLPAAVLAAAWWAWHPLRVESVAWAAERKDVMSVFFGLLAVCFYLRFADLERQAGRRTRLWFWLAMLAGAAAILSKAMLVMLPCLLCLLDFWPLGRWRRRVVTLDSGSGVYGDTADTIKGRSAWFLVLEKWPLWLHSIATAALTIWVQKVMGAVSDDWIWTHRAANAVVAASAYGMDSVWPHGLAVFYPHEKQLSAEVVLAALAPLLVLAGLAWRWRVSRAHWLLGLAWFLVSWWPVSGFMVQAGLQARADRYTYLPSFGMAFVLAAEIARASSIRCFRVCLVPVGLAVLSLLVVATRAQIRVWADARSLFSHAVSVTRGNFYAWYALGHVHQRAGELPEARKCYESALAISPDFAPACLQLGLLIEAQGENERALSLFDTVLTNNPTDAGAYMAKAGLLVRSGRTSEAVTCFQRALQYYPQTREANFQLARIYTAAGRIEQAIQAYRREIELQPRYAEAHNNLANLYAKNGKLDDALAEYETALRLSPEYAEAWANAGLLLWKLERRQEGLVHLRKALYYGPNIPGLGDLLARLEQETGR